MDGWMYSHETTKFLGWKDQISLSIGLPLHAIHARGALGQLRDVDILLILQVFRAPFVEAKELFTRNVCTYTLYIVIIFLFLVTGNSFKGTHNWGVTMFSSWLYILQDIDQIFSNITDIYEFSVTFLGLLDAAIEVADEGKQPAIGECFEEMAEVTLCVWPHFCMGLDKVLNGRKLAKSTLCLYGPDP